MTSRLQNYVNGQLVDAKSGRFSDVIDPTSGEPYLEAPISGQEDVDAAYAAAAAAFESWGDTTPAERAARPPAAGAADRVERLRQPGAAHELSERPRAGGVRGPHHRLPPPVRFVRGQADLPPQQVARGVRHLARHGLRHLDEPVGDETLDIHNVHAPHANGRVQRFFPGGRWPRRA